MQKLDLRGLSGQTFSDVEHFEPFGFTSHPKPGAEHLTLLVDGDPNHPITLVVSDRRYRLTTLQEGEVALYDAFGNKAHFLTDGTLAIVASKQVQITSPLVTLSGDLQVAGNVQVTGSVQASGSIASAVSVTAPQVSGTSDVKFGPFSGTAHIHSDTTVAAVTGPPTS
jgi:phage baseplate assembly protein V